MERPVPSLSDAAATVDAEGILHWVEKAYLMGASRDDVVSFIAVSLQLAYTRGAGAGSAHLAECLRG